MTIANVEPRSGSERTAARDSLRPSRGLKIFVGIFAITPVFLLSAFRRTFDKDVFFIIFLVAAISLVLAVYCYRWFRRIAQRRRNATALGKVEDPRGFVLYLRSFLTAGQIKVRNTLPSMADRALVGAYWDAELALQFAFEDECAFIAIGDKHRSLGAAKIITDDEHWKDLFHKLVEKCRSVLIVPIATPGTMFEIDVLTSHPVYLRKTIFVMPPTYFLKRLLSIFSARSYRKPWTEIRAQLAKRHVEFPEYRRKGCLFVLDPHCQLLRKFPAGSFDAEYLSRLTKEIQAADSDVPVERKRKIDTISVKPPGRLSLFWDRWGDLTLRFLPALLVVFAIRTFLFQPFFIPSGSMKPTLLIGDYLFVSKYSYGFTHYSAGGTLPLFAGRIFGSEPQRGDVVVFRLPRDDSIDYIRRVIGLPGDRVQMIAGQLHLNGQPVKRERVDDDFDEVDGQIVRVKRWRETLPSGASYLTLQDNGPLDNTPIYDVPAGHYFMMGDNRDKATDSRALSQVGYVPFEKLVGKAQIIFYSIGEGEDIWQFWRWPWTVRLNRLLKPVH
jgi:signal peptidase I